MKARATSEAKSRLKPAPKSKSLLQEPGSPGFSVQSVSPGIHARAGRRSQSDKAELKCPRGNPPDRASARRGFPRAAAGALAAHGVLAGPRPLSVPHGRQLAGPWPRSFLGLCDQCAPLHRPPAGARCRLPLRPPGMALFPADLGHHLLARPPLLDRRSRAPGAGARSRRPAAGRRPLQLGGPGVRRSPRGEPDARPGRRLPAGARPRPAARAGAARPVSTVLRRTGRAPPHPLGPGPGRRRSPSSAD